MVVATVAAGREEGLRALLDSMNSAPGVVDPCNEVLPFGVFERLHEARFVLLDDATMADLQAHGVRPPRVPTALAFMGECDGPAPQLLAQMAGRARTGLTRVFAHCDGFDAEADLLTWMLAHERPPAAFYANRVGRTVRRIGEEKALRLALAARVARDPAASAADARQRRDELVAFVDAEVRAGRLKLTPPEPTPLRWRVANLANLAGVPLLGLIAAPFLVAALPFLAVMLRAHEKSDPEVCPRPAPDAVRALQRIEDHDVTNQFTAIGPLKPGVFRRTLLTVLLAAVDWLCRHVYDRGHLARVQTIHFARWVFLDGKTRGAFASSHDGSHEACMDDFVNKVGWGLNVLFSNGVGWPRTDWLIKGGARRERPFRHYQRRHQLPSQVWYKAYPGLTLTDLERGRRIRAGLERRNLSDAEALAWLRLL